MPKQPSGHASGPEGQPERSTVARPRYRLYIDESGDHVLRDEHAMANPVHRFLALCGCIFQGDDYVAFHDAWEGLKRRHFPHSPDEPILMHRSDMINRRGDFRWLRDCGADESFRQDLLRVIEAARFAIVMVTIDKLSCCSSYAAPLHPYHLGFGCMLQRYCGFLNHVNRLGDVMAESRGRREDELLKDAYQHIHAHGDMPHKAEFYQRVLTSKELKLKKKSANISGLQLADILAYPLRQAILAEKGLVAAQGTFGAQLASVAEAKYHRQPDTGTIDGYGRIFFAK